MGFRVKKGKGLAEIGGKQAKKKRGVGPRGGNPAEETKKKTDQKKKAGESLLANGKPRPAGNWSGKSTTNRGVEGGQKGGYHQGFGIKPKWNDGTNPKKKRGGGRRKGTEKALQKKYFFKTEKKRCVVLGPQ